MTRIMMMITSIASYPMKRIYAVYVLTDKLKKYWAASMLIVKNALKSGERKTTRVPCADNSKRRRIVLT